MDNDATLLIRSLQTARSILLIDAPEERSPHSTSSLRKGSPRMSDEQNKSVGWVVGMVALVVTYFGWAILAAQYFQHNPNGEAGETDFWANSIAMLPKLPSVLGYAFRE